MPLSQKGKEAAAANGPGVIVWPISLRPPIDCHHQLEIWQLCRMKNLQSAPPAMPNYNAG
jgi:hypothetical protein